MRVNLDALAVLDAIDRKGSFAGAAEEQFRVPSAITYTMQKLEQDLGIAIFDRSGHRARLTPPGKKLLEEGRHLLRAANELERTMTRMATGWEADLTVAVGDLIALEHVYPLAEKFYETECGTRLRLTTEVLGGIWDALVSGRADLVIGASGEGPPGGGYASRAVGTVAFIFVVAPHHPLADAPEPLADETILQHRVVAAADSSRNLPARTSAIMGGQDVLTVPSMEAKLDAHRRGLGVGYVPRCRAAADLERGHLIAKQVTGALPNPQVFIAWRTEGMGKALKWFLQQLEQPGWFRDALD